MRFRRRLTVLVLLAAIAPAIGLGWGLIAINQDALEETNRELLFSVIDDVSHTLDGAFDAASLGLATIGHALANADASPAERIATTRQLVAALPGLDVVGFYDEHGARFEVARRAGDTTVLPDALPEGLRREADRTGKALGPVTRGPGGPRLAIVEPIVLPNATWYAYAPVALAALDARVAEIARVRFDGEADSVFVVDRQLRVVSHPDPEQQVARDVAILEDFGGTPPGAQFLVYATYPTAHGEMVGAVRSLPTMPFAVVAQVPRAKAFASIARMRRVVIGVVGVAIALAALIAFVLARRVSAPIAKLVDFSHALAARRFAARAGVHTGDELEVLGDAMTDAARALEAGETRLVEEAAIRRDLGRYLPAQLVDKIVDHTQSLELGGHKRTVTVLFADVASFTALSESQPPEVIVAILNQLFTVLTEVVFRHGGTIDKFVGDCVMAFWNAPDDQPDHAGRAVAAAGDMLRWLELCNEAWRARFGVTLHLAIGINTGEVVVGNFGSEARMTYTCIGDPVNVAARLESIARPQQILVSKRTRDEAPGACDYVAVGAQHVPGRLEPIEAFEVSL